MREKRKLRIRECRECKKAYKPPSPWPGCCSEKCLNLRLDLLEKRRTKLATVKKQRAFDPSSRKWLALRFSILRKFGWACMACGAKPPLAVIQVDHIKPRSKYPHLTWEASNLQVLCKECNIGKSDTDETDFRIIKNEPDFLTDAAKGGTHG